MLPGLFQKAMSLASALSHEVKATTNLKHNEQKQQRLKQSVAVTAMQHGQLLLALIFLQLTQLRRLLAYGQSIGAQNLS